MENKEFTVIKRTLHQLISSTLGYMIILLITLINKLTGLDYFILSKSSIYSEITGWTILIIGLIITIIVSNSYERIILSYKKIEDKNEKDSAKLFLSSYIILLNPFADNGKNISTKLYDGFGYAIARVMRFAIFLIGISFIHTKSTITIVFISIIGFIIGVLTYVERMEFRSEIMAMCPKSINYKFTIAVLYFLLLIL